VAAYRVVTARDSLPPGAARHVVLVVFDTLRADRMSLYGHTAPTSPRLEQVSGELLRYGSATATAPWTLPSHASMFTGLWPSEHGAQWGHFELSEEHLTLAEILDAEGFCTFGLSANPFVSEATGLTQGFDAFKVAERVTSPELLRLAAQLLLHASDCGRMFLFINLMDTHIPYTYGSYAEQFGVSAPPILTADDKWAVSSGKRTLTADEIGQHQAAYDAAVRLTDDLAGAVLEILRRQQLLEKTLVVFTSDHGEGLTQHQEVGHVLSVWEEQLAVPLLVRLPEARRGGEVFGRRVSLVGLTPSILDWLAVPRPPELQGRPNLEQTADLPVLADYRSYFSETRRGFNQEMGARYPALARRISHHHVIYCDRYKLIVSPGDRAELYDLLSDPQELHDLSDNRQEVLNACMARYTDRLEAGIFTPFDRPTPETPASQETLEHLKSLGYLQ